MPLSLNDVTLRDLEDLREVSSRGGDLELKELCELALGYIQVVHSKYSSMPTLAQTCAWLHCVLS